MRRKKHTAEQIIQKVREAEIALAQGQPFGAVCKGFQGPLERPFREGAVRTLD